jgi:anthranilate phosphoribosyltransferase
VPNPVLTDALERLASGCDLGVDETALVLEQIMGGYATDVETGAFLVALRTKGETVYEMVGLARTMRKLCVPVETGRDDLLDTAGTGGGRPTFNVSTTAALVAAGYGCYVAKHGNRSATGRCGSADVLEALGACLDLDAGAVAECINTVGFGFMFAPHHHLATRHVVAVRKELAVRTVFNFLGPLTNPAGASHQVIGVSDPSKLDAIAAACLELGTERALVVSSDDGLDEISASEPTRVVELAGGRLSRFVLRPEDLGFEPVPTDCFQAGLAEQNALITRRVLSGQSGPERTVCVLNAAAAIYVAGGCSSIAEGVQCAQQAIDSGASQRLLEHYVEKSNGFGSY